MKLSEEELEDLFRSAAKSWDNLLNDEQQVQHEISMRLAKASMQGADQLLIKVNNKEKCDHGVIFDEEDAKKINDPYKIRQKYPRGWGPCPKGCGFNGIAYASYMHYIMGDY